MSVGLFFFQNNIIFSNCSNVTYKFSNNGIFDCSEDSLGKVYVEHGRSLDSQSDELYQYLDKYREDILSFLDDNYCEIELDMRISNSHVGLQGFLNEYFKPNNTDDQKNPDLLQNKRGVRAIFQFLFPNIKNFFINENNVELKSLQQEFKNIFEKNKNSNQIDYLLFNVSCFENNKNSHNENSYGNQYQRILIGILSDFYIKFANNCQVDSLQNFKISNISDFLCHYKNIEKNEKYIHMLLKFLIKELKIMHYKLENNNKNFINQLLNNVNFRNYHIVDVGNNQKIIEKNQQQIKNLESTQSLLKILNYNAINNYVNQNKYNSQNISDINFNGNINYNINGNVLNGSNCQATKMCGFDNNLYYCYCGVKDKLGEDEFNNLNGKSIFSYNSDTKVFINNNICYDCNLSKQNIDYKFHKYKFNYLLTFLQSLKVDFKSQHQKEIETLELFEDNKPLVNEFDNLLRIANGIISNNVDTNSMNLFNNSLTSFIKMTENLSKFIDKEKLNRAKITTIGGSNSLENITTNKIIKYDVLVESIESILEKLFDSVNSQKARVEPKLREEFYRCCDFFFKNDVIIKNNELNNNHNIVVTDSFSKLKNSLDNVLNSLDSGRDAFSLKVISNYVFDQETVMNSEEFIAYLIEIRTLAVKIDNDNPNDHIKNFKKNVDSFINKHSNINRSSYQSYNNLYWMNCAACVFFVGAWSVASLFNTETKQEEEIDIEEDLGELKQNKG